MSVVADLLTASRQAHLRYRRYAGSCDTKGNISQAYDEPKCVEAVEQALDTRSQAHAIDPDHTDPAWGGDTAAHGELVAFYRKFLR